MAPSSRTLVPCKYCWASASSMRPSPSRGKTSELRRADFVDAFFVSDCADELDASNRFAPSARGVGSACLDCIGGDASPDSICRPASADCRVLSAADAELMALEPASAPSSESRGTLVAGPFTPGAVADKELTGADAAMKLGVAAASGLADC